MPFEETCNRMLHKNPLNKLQLVGDFVMQDASQRLTESCSTSIQGKQCGRGKPKFPLFLFCFEFYFHASNFAFELKWSTLEVVS
jgi:hypothetical protein